MSNRSYDQRGSAMPASTLAGLITAIATALTALGGTVLSLTVLIPMFRQTKSTHVIVNQQRTDMLRYQKALEAALATHGIDVPVDQSKMD